MSFTETGDETYAGFRIVDGVQRVYLHISDAKMFRSCRREWKFGSPRQMNMTPVVPSMKFWLGTGIHLGLQHYYQHLHGQEGEALDDLARRALELYTLWADTRIKHTQRRIIDLPQEHLDKMEETASLGFGMLEHYFEWCKEVDNFKTVLVEHTFELPLRLDGHILMVPMPDGTKSELWMKGRIDAVVETPDGKWWLVEHKTMASIWTEYYTLYDEQSGVYTDAAQETLEGLLGVKKEISGVLYNLLRKKVPTVPEELKNGGLTRRKNIDTTYKIYEQELLKRGLDPKEYEEILTLLSEKKNRFFRREPVFRTQAEIREIKKRLYYIMCDMVNNPVIYPNPDFFKCRMCSFQTVCVAMSNGADWEWILRKNYETRQEEEEAVEVIDEPYELLEAN